MDDSTRDRMKGKIDQAGGKIKEKAGQAMNDPEMEGEGKAEQGKGKVEEKVGDVKKVFEK
jgi:uncharacterized protein YjbJ (UPF0337 family)